MAHLGRRLRDSASDHSDITLTIRAKIQAACQNSTILTRRHMFILCD